MLLVLFLMYISMLLIIFMIYGKVRVHKNISEYIPQTIEVTIPVPIKENKMKRLFNFLDKDEIDVN